MKFLLKIFFFRYEKIIEFVPEDDHKLINHIRKALRRKERKKTQEKKSEDKDNKDNNNDIDDEDILGSSDDEDEEMEQPQKKVQPKMQGRQLGKNKKVIDKFPRKFIKYLEIFKRISVNFLYYFSNYLN